MSHFRILSAITGILCLIAVLFVTSCDQTIDPIVGEDRPFTIWGYLDANADTQKVRVFTIENRLGLDRSGPIDAVVTSTHIGSGEQRQWVHSQVIFADSTSGHIFWSAFTPDFDEEYRLDVRRSDGATSSAQVRIPPFIEIELVGEKDRAVVPVILHGKPPNLVDIVAIYDAITLPPANPWPPGPTTPAAVRLPVSVSYSLDEVEPTANGWTFDINLRSDFAVIQDVFESNCLPSDLIALRSGIELRFLAADKNWSPPEGSFDPNLLIEPGTFSNVDNGFGFFGGGYVVSRRWRPSDAIIRSIGFRTGGPCPLVPANVPECQLPPEPCLDQNQ